MEDKKGGKIMKGRIMRSKIMKRGIVVGICLCMLTSNLMLSDSIAYADDKNAQGADIVSEPQKPDVEEESTKPESTKPESTKPEETNPGGGINPPEVVEGNIVEEKIKEIAEGIAKEKAIQQESKMIQPKAEATTPVIWDGTTDTTWFTNNTGQAEYVISTPAQLAGLAKLVNEGNPMTDITFKLANDIYLNDDADPKQHQWPMIGKDAANYFNGSFDGQGHTVYNVYVNETAVDFVGFLGIVSHVTPLKNIVITGSITGNLQAGLIGYINTNEVVTLEGITNKADIAAVSAGGIVTEATYLRIKDCVNEGTIKGTATNVGGLLAYSYGQTYMMNCHNKGNVTGPKQTGGLIGHGGSMYISDSSNTGTVTGEGNDVGGLVGGAKGDRTTVQISNSTHNGDVRGWEHVGGIIGANTGGDITNCKNLGGKVEAKHSNAGGIVGFQTTKTNSAETRWGSIISCSNKASITAGTGNEAGKMQNAGGIVGGEQRTKSITNCVNEGTITATEKFAGGIVGTGAGGEIADCTNSGAITATTGDCAAGIRGHGTGKISGCTNSGNIKSGNQFSGGIQGNNAQADIINCTNKGNVEGKHWIGGITGENSNKIIGCTNEGDIKGGWYIAGIVGDGNNTLLNCKNSGNITAAGDSGGIRGRGEGTIEACENIGATIAGDEGIGGIVGNGKDNNTLLNCKNSGNITANKLGGGIRGRGTGVIESCGNSGDVTSTGDHIGGIQGEDSQANIISCTNTGNIKGVNWVGGIAGQNSKEVTGCTNEGTVTGNKYVAGIVGNGKDNNTLFNCKNFGEIIGYGGVGGIRGTGLGEIKECGNSGDVTGTEQFIGGIQGDNSQANIIKCTNTGNVKGINWVGGIAGQNSKEVTECTNEGTVTGGWYTAGIVGDGNSTLLNCQNSGKISGNTRSGGIRGSGAGIIEGCENSGEVTGTSDYIGGIQGNDSQFNIIKCTNTGDVKGVNWVGGIAGENSKEVTDCSNTGAVTGTKYIAGIVGNGKDNNTLLRCVNSGKIIGHGGVGGIRGIGPGEIRECKNTGDVTATEHYIGGIQGDNSGANIVKCTNTGNIEGVNYVAGIAGENSKEVTDCINEGAVTGAWHTAGIVGNGKDNNTLLNCKNSGKISGSTRSGGIRGSGVGIIEGCENSGDVTGTSDYIGGIQGNDSQSDILKCTNTGDIKGTNQVGGIAGQNHKAVTECTNNGSVEGTWYIGGILGQGTASLANCENLGGQVTGVHNTGGIIGESPSATATITNCVNKATVNGNELTAGIVAYVEGEKQITGCINQGEIKVNPSGTVLAKQFGGIVGYAATAKTEDTEGIQINNCINEGTIRSNGTYTGGIVGLNYGTISECTNKGKMFFSGLDDTNDALYLVMGQIAGQSVGNITSCTNEGDMDVELKAEYLTNNNQANNDLRYGIGGICGEMVKAEITGCTNRGAIFARPNNQPKSNTYSYEIGGIVGTTLGATVEKSYNFGDIQGKDERQDKGTEDNFSLGGIVGEAWHQKGTHSKINECVNSGDLRVNTHAARAGGITANANTSDITNCASIGDLYSDTDDAVFLSGITHGFNAAEDNPSKMDNVYFAGKMFLIDDKKTNVSCLSGIAGNVTWPGTMKHSYYDMDALGYDVTAADNFGSELDSNTFKGLHTSDMVGAKAKTAMTGFDFENMWVMHKDKIEPNNNMRYYPSLQSKPDIKHGVKFYLVSFEKNAGYKPVVSDPYDETGFVLPNKDFEFTLKMKDGYEDMDCVVKDNGAEIAPATAKSRVYKISNIQEDHNITVALAKRTPTVTFPDEVTIHYGQSLKDAPFEFEGKGKMTFKEADRKLAVKESGQKFIMVFVPDDQIQYETVEKEVTVYVTPIKTSKPEDIHLGYTKDLELGGVALPKGWSWQEPTTIVQVGTHPYKASFHDEEGNYLDETDVDINVIMDKEADKPGKPDKPTAPDKPAEPATPNRAVHTGDANHMAWYAICAILALGIVTAIVAVRVSKGKKRK